MFCCAIVILVIFVFLHRHEVRTALQFVALLMIIKMGCLSAARIAAAGNRGGQAASSSSTPPPMEREQERNGECDWDEVPIPDGAVEYSTRRTYSFARDDSGYIPLPQNAQIVFRNPLNPGEGACDSFAGQDSYMD